MENIEQQQNINADNDHGSDNGHVETQEQRSTDRKEQIRAALFGEKGEQRNEENLVSGSQSTEKSDYPKSWKKEFVEKWNTLDPEVKKEIKRLENDSYARVGQYKQMSEKHLELAQAGAALLEEMQPYAPMLRALGATPQVVIRDLLTAAYVLYQGTPEQKRELIRNAVSRHKIDISELEDSGQPYVDPAVQKLQEEIALLKNERVSEAQRMSQQELGSAMQEVNRFVSEADRPFFDELRPLMINFLNAGIAKDLQTAYDMALRVHPQAFERLVQDKLGEFETDKRRRASQAKSTALSVVGSPNGSGISTASPSGKSLRDEIRAALAAHSS